MLVFLLLSVAGHLKVYDSINSMMNTDELVKSAFSVLTFPCQPGCSLRQSALNPPTLIKM